MALIGILILPVLLTVGVLAAANPATKLCARCHGNVNPALCTTMARCHSDEECNRHMNILIGKREPDNQANLLCINCCEQSNCNQHQCEHFMLTTTKAPTATPSTSSITSTATTATSSTSFITSTATTPTSPPSITGSNLCRNHEEDGVTCTSMAHYKFCSVQDPTTFSYDIAHNKCAKYCGFCGTNTTRAQTTLDSTCTDHEVGGFRCADYDQYNVCTDVSGVARSIALNQCPKHCGLCGSQHTTGAPNPVTMTSFKPLITVPRLSQVQLTTGNPCVDREDSTFSCASWANNGFCQTTSGMLHDITVFRCSKYCGLC